MAKDIKPAVSVVMSVYNGTSYVRDAIASILQQDFKDFEFIIVNDGSQDDSLNIIRSFKDKRIKIIDQENQGLVESLNTAIKMAKGKLIARQDDDDISLPERLKQQVTVFNENSDLVLTGSSIITMDANSKQINEHHVLLSDPELKQELLIRSPFAHGSVMFKKAAFEKTRGYKQDEWPAEDYGLWIRMALSGKLANIDQPLYKYRENPKGISSQNREVQRQRTIATQKNAWRNRKVYVPNKISTNGYDDQRLDRIANNILFGVKKSLKTLNIIYFYKHLALLVNNKDIFRKSIRLLLIALKLKHV